MSELILHHYRASPFAEKVRSLLGYKGLAWRSVTVPLLMPKPHLVALTGGYRVIPVLQIGADIYLDSKLIAERLEQAQPEPSLHPPGCAASERALATWGEAIFLDVVTLAFCEGLLTPDFLRDRADTVAPNFFDRNAALAVRRHSPEVGEVVVHFPREGFAVARI